MATITVTPGALVTMDPADEKVIEFDFDQRNLAAGASLTNTGPFFGITIEALKQNDPLAALTFDNASLMAGNRKVRARFLATTATLGDRYTVSVQGTTNETPVQKKEYSITILIQDH